MTARSLTWTDVVEAGMHCVVLLALRCCVSISEGDHDDAADG